MSTTYDFDNLRFRDVLYSRDVDARIEELSADATLDDIGRDELAALVEFKNESSNAEWPYGQEFVRDSYFTEYAQQLAEDIGAIEEEARWPAYCIDWEQAARDLQMDYYSVELDGITYWTR